MLVLGRESARVASRITFVAIVVVPKSRKAHTVP